jgi:hypothetical protein
VLLVGVYGSGKSSVCVEMAEALESAGLAYGAIDLDWMGWYDAPGGGDGHGFGDPVGLANLACMVENYLGVGVEHFVLAGTVWADRELAGIRSVLPFPLRVVHLTLPYAEIEARLSTAPTSGRANDLREARRQSDELRFDFADLVVASDRPVPEVAGEIIDWLGWR